MQCKLKENVAGGGAGSQVELPALNDTGKAFSPFWNFLAMNLKISELEQI